MELLWQPGEKLENVEKRVILTALQFYQGNKTATAQALGIGLRTLYDKLDRYKANGTVLNAIQNSDSSNLNEHVPQMPKISDTEVTKVPEVKPEARPVPVPTQKKRA